MSQSVFMYRERWYPYALGILGFAVCWLFRSDFVMWARSHEIDVAAIAAAVFDISTILTAFLFSFFGIVIAPGGGFVEKIFRTKTFRLFTRYVAEALFLGFSLTILSVPFMVSKAASNLGHLSADLAVSVWAFFCVSAFAAFVRVAHVFLIWIRARSEIKSDRVRAQIA